MKKFLLFVSALIALSSLSAQDYLQQANIDSIRVEADNGNSKAQFELGYCYIEGWNVEQNIRKGLAWIELSANQGYVEAEYHMGLFSIAGMTGSSCEETVSWLRKAAEKGHAHAQYYLGWCYSVGFGVGASYPAAVKWMKKSADQGDPDAEYNLGKCYEYGLGVTTSKTEALKWYRKAAAQNYKLAKEGLDRLGVEY